MGYFAAVTTLKPALLEQEKVPRPSPEQVNRTLASLGLDPEMSAWDRYIQWLTNVVTKFDWGRSPNSGYINQEFGQRLWVSTRLMLAATILTIIIGVALGVYSAARQYKFSDRVITGYSYLVYIIPAPVAYFVVQQGATAINNIVVENGGEKIFYVTGISTPGVTGFWDTTIDMAAHYVVPTFCMTIFGWASYQIAQRQYLLEYFRQCDGNIAKLAGKVGMDRTNLYRKLRSLGIDPTHKPKSPPEPVGWGTPTRRTNAPFPPGFTFGGLALASHGVLIP